MDIKQDNLEGKQETAALMTHMIVLSGFIIMTAHFDDDNSLAALKTYGIKRFVRIFPPYWPISISLMVLYGLLPTLSQGARGELSWLSSLLLLPDVNPPALPVAWTMIHEMIFYAVFSLFSFSRRFFLIFLAGWVLSICVTNFTGAIGNSSLFVARLLAPINLEFVMGLSMAYFAHRINHFADIFIICGCFVFVILLLGSPALENRFLFGLPFSLLVLGVVLRENRDRWLLPHWMVMLGNASYSIYLIHNPLVSLTSRIVAHLHDFATWELGLLFKVAARVVVGLLYHLFVEKPLIRCFRWLFSTGGALQPYNVPN